MKIAVIHDWLVTEAGAEKVLERILITYPQADLFSTVDFLEGKQRDFIGHRQVTTSFIQRLPKARTAYRQYLPLMPLAVEQFDLSSYDLVISSSHAVAKGVLTGPRQLHVCMCYSPIRYAWDLQHQYLRESGLDRGFKTVLVRPLLHYMRLWDQRTGPGVDVYIAISEFIAARIQKTYHRSSVVIYPPVNTTDFTLHEEKQGYYVTASRMVPYKRIDLIVEAFARMPDKRLVVIGDGPEMARVRALSAPNIKILGHQPFAVMREYLQQARAFIFAAEEDFGIAPVEAQACGTPVIAYGQGGALETIQDGVSGIFFKEQTITSLMQAVFRFEELPPFSTIACRKNALRFDTARFDSEFRLLIADACESFFAGKLVEK